MNDITGCECDMGSECPIGRVVQHRHGGPAMEVVGHFKRGPSEEEAELYYECFWSADPIGHGDFLASELVPFSGMNGVQ